MILNFEEKYNLLSVLSELLYNHSIFNQAVCECSILLIIQKAILLHLEEESTTDYVVFCIYQVSTIV